MAYDEDLAGRVRAALPGDAEVTERRIFGGLPFLLGGHMFAGVLGTSSWSGLATRPPSGPWNPTTSGRWTSPATQ
jgi:hypothetical protein